MPQAICRDCNQTIMTLDSVVAERIRVEGCTACKKARRLVVYRLLKRAGLRPDDPWVGEEVEEEAAAPLVVDYPDDPMGEVNSLCLMCGQFTWLEVDGYCVNCGHGIEDMREDL